jgi:hypothetical protein
MRRINVSPKAREVPTVSIPLVDWLDAQTQDEKFVTKLVTLVIIEKSGLHTHLASSLGKPCSCGYEMEPCTGQ